MSSSEVQAFVNSLRSTFSYLEALHIPTIAVIEGAALGGGLEMALSCDLRICGEDAVLGLPETGLAIIPGAGGTQRLPRLVGRSVAKELIFCGRKVGGRDAVSMGLVNHCVPAGEAHLKALEIARNINQKVQVCMSPESSRYNWGAMCDACEPYIIQFFPLGLFAVMLILKISWHQQLSFTCQTLRSGSIHCIPCKTKTAPMSKSISDKPCVGLVR
ncbi:probable enoyl-CoA hydratase 2, mitochondrial isoform X2 [Camellia sinensis]|nr:probable enoyl-CoA hydratase 2, mitochondrial isoform X2 [Camellia sinensis]XP_028079556.1 probable enoyl-CoA hydratase 2, mitochondrial isoform X2 [Camellia sinensis]